jgi:hypothetical protein
MVQRRETLSIVMKGYSMNWTPQQLSQEIQYQAENDGFTSCFGMGWLQSFKWPFVNTTTENRSSTGDPRSKPDRKIHLCTCTGCGESISQPESRDWHVEKEHATLSNGSTQFSTPTPAPTPTETVLNIMSIQSIKAFVMVQKSPEKIEQRPQTYTWEQFRGLGGAMDAMEDFCRKWASAQA